VSLLRQVLRTLPFLANRKLCSSGRRQGHKADMTSDIPARLVEQLRSLVTPGARMVDEFECVTSVLLAILLAHLIGATMIAWAAFTAFVLIRGHIAETLLRAVLRLVGTALGAGLALVLVPLASGSLPATMLCAALVGSIGLYGTLTAKRAYAWLLFGLTFEMILLDKLEHPGLDTVAFARTRLLEVAAGTVACLAVSMLSTLTLRRLSPASPPPVLARTGWHSDAARHSAQAGLTLALLPPLHVLFAMPELAQAGVTIMAVMIVPVAGIGASGLIPVSRRLFDRAAGCLAGGTLAAAILFMAQGRAAVLIGGTCLGIVIGRHIENGASRTTYLGLQFTLAILVTLVPDSYAVAEIGPALARLSSILIGMALLEPVLLAWHVIAPERQPAVATSADRSSE
jgi:uncharacterized membrane protein YccC